MKTPKYQNIDSNSKYKKIYQGSGNIPEEERT